MGTEHRRWLEQLPYDSLLLYRQAFVLQYLLLFIAGAAVVGAILAPFANRTPESLITAILLYTVVLLGTLGAIWLLRRGSLHTAGITVVLVILFVIGSVFVLYGKSHVEYTLPGLTVPIVLAGMILGRRMLWLTGALAVAIVAVTSFGIVYAPQWFGTLRTPETPPPVFVAGLTLVVAVVSLFLDRFGGLLRQAFEQAHAREVELDALRESLERTVAERTAALQQKVDELRAAHDTVRMLSVPVLPVLPGVLVLPLIGAFDNRRIDELRHTALHAVAQRRAGVVIFDVTGILSIDTHTAQALLQTAAAVRLLGAQPWLVGLRADVAQTIVGLDIDMRAFRTSASLESAIGTLAENINTEQLTRRNRTTETSLNGSGAGNLN
ncbi:MAG: STAS domain-containing protein [Roseiflexus sp.]